MTRSSTAVLIASVSVHWWMHFQHQLTEMQLCIMEREWLPRRSGGSPSGTALSCHAHDRFLSEVNHWLCDHGAISCSINPVNKSLSRCVYGRASSLGESVSNFKKKKKSFKWHRSFCVHPQKEEEEEEEDEEEEEEAEEKD